MAGAVKGMSGHAPAQSEVNAIPTQAEIDAVRRMKSMSPLEADQVVTLAELAANDVDGATMRLAFASPARQALVRRHLPEALAEWDKRQAAKPKSLSREEFRAASKGNKLVRPVPIRQARPLSPRPETIKQARRCCTWPQGGDKTCPTRFGRICHESTSRRFQIYHVSKRFRATRIAETAWADRDPMPVIVPRSLAWHDALHLIQLHVRMITPSHQSGIRTCS